MALLICLHMGCANDLDEWESEELDGGVTEIRCPGCGALHHTMQSSNGELYIELTEDNG